VSLQAEGQDRHADEEHRDYTYDLQHNHNNTFTAWSYAVVCIFLVTRHCTESNFLLPYCLPCSGRYRCCPLFSAKSGDKYSLCFSRILYLMSDRDTNIWEGEFVLNSNSNSYLMFKIPKTENSCPVSALLLWDGGSGF
jgi:hypothetical protein